jgi:signal transduction histidine kinase
MSDSERLDRLIEAEQDERRRLALFLHDGPVQELAGIALMLDAATHLIATDRAGEAAEIVATALTRHRETIRELRDLSFALEPVILRDQGLAPALNALADRVGRSHKLRIDLDLDAAAGIGETTQVAIYTIIRELLDQSIRRGPPTRIAVTLSRDDDGGLVAVVADDAEPERRRRSFETIEERVRQLHGEIELAATEHGTEVRVRMPPVPTQS